VEDIVLGWSFLFGTKSQENGLSIPEIILAGNEGLNDRHGQAMSLAEVIKLMDGEKDIEGDGFKVLILGFTFKEGLSLMVYEKYGVIEHLYMSWNHIDIWYWYSMTPWQILKRWGMNIGIWDNFR